MRPCLVNGIKATFHKWMHKAWVVAPSPMIGGHPGGQMEMDLAIIEYADGTVSLCSPIEIQFTDNEQVKDIKHVLNKLESAYKGGNTPADYHNPSDVELLRKARKALHKGISELKIHCKYFDQTPEEDACIEMHEAVVEIDKALEVE